MLALALSPIILLILALAVFKVRAHIATLGAALFALVIACIFFSTSLPLARVPAVVADGVSFALFPICLVVLAALFVYSVTVASGAMEKIRADLSCVSTDRRVLALLIVWGFGTFMEGMAGFGTAVAIPAALLVGIGFDPMKAVLMCLVANTTSTAYGSVGVPLLTLARESGVALDALSWRTATLQLVVMALGPFLILAVAGGRAALKGAFRLAFLADVAFLVPWLFAARFLGPELPDILGGLAVLVVLTGVEMKKGRRALSLREVLFSWAPFACAVALLILAALLPASIKAFAPSGLLVLVGGFLGGRVQGLSLSRLFAVLFTTVRTYLATFATIIFVLVLARVMTNAGMVSAIAKSLVAATGPAYPFFSPLVGALGGFVTGSGTSANVLFGALQAGAAAKLQVSTPLLAAANMMGAGIGKMVSPQSIAIGTAAAMIAPRAGEAFRRIAVWFFFVILFACLVTGGFSLL